MLIRRVTVSSFVRKQGSYLVKFSLKQSMLYKVKISMKVYYISESILLFFRYAVHRCRFHFIFLPPFFLSSNYRSSSSTISFTLTNFVLQIFDSNSHHTLCKQSFPHRCLPTIKYFLLKVSYTLFDSRFRYQYRTEWSKKQI